MGEEIKVNKKKKKNVGRKVVSVILVIIIIILLGILVNWFLEQYTEYKDIKDTNEGLVDDFFNIDWDKLLAINGDIVAWLRIPDTDISYPVVKGKTNDEYLRKDIYGKYSKGGTLFVDANIDYPFDCPNTIIYGHNLMNGTMFSTLNRWSKLDYAKAHSAVEIYLPYVTSPLVYDVVSFHTVNANNINLYNPYVDDIVDYANYMYSGNTISDMEVDIKSTDEVLTLSTCTNRGSTRYVLHAVLDE